jgi:hypothetical protein
MAYPLSGARDDRFAPQAAVRAPPESGYSWEHSRPSPRRPISPTNSVATIRSRFSPAAPLTKLPTGAAPTWRERVGPLANREPTGPPARRPNTRVHGKANKDRQHKPDPVIAIFRVEHSPRTRLSALGVMRLYKHAVLDNLALVDLPKPEGSSPESVMIVHSRPAERECRRARNGRSGSSSAFRGFLDR